MPADPAAVFLRRMHKLCREQAYDLFTAVETIMAAPAGPSAPATRDHARLLSSVRSQDRQELWSRVGLSWLHLTVNVADHVRALALLMSQPQEGVPIYAHTSVARVAVESAAALLYLVDRRCGFEERFGRGVAFLLADADLATKAAAKVPGNAVMAAPGAAVAAEQKGLLSLIEQARIEVIPGRGGIPKGVRISPGTPEALVSVKAIALVEDAFADMPAVYDLLSGVVHGKPWQLGSQARTQGRYATWAADPMDVASAVLVATTAAYRVAAEHAWYRGHEDDPTIRRIQKRTATVDTELRQFATKQIGAERLKPSIARFQQHDRPDR